MGLLATLRMFADIEGTYMLDELGTSFYNTQKLDGKVVTVGDVTITYAENSLFRVGISFE